MKKLYISAISILSLLLFLPSCSDFLDEDSREKVEEEDSEVYSAQQVLTAVYGMFDSWEYAFAYLGVTEVVSDNADKGSSPGDAGTDKDILDNLTYTSSVSSVESMWKHWYTSIGRATNSIQYTQESGMTNTELANRFIAEAKFLRGLNYFFLVRGWGDVPIQEIDVTVRASKDSVYDYIERDLLDAENTLPVRSGYAANDMGRATKGAAQALLAKVYLYQKEWQKAYDYAEKVISSGEYALLPNYIDVFKSDAQYHNSKESIFEFQAKASDAALPQGIQQYSQTQGARGDTGWGWGFNTPSQSLLNDYNESGDTIRRNATIIFRNSTLWDGRWVGSTENPMYNYKAYSSSAPGNDQNDRFVLYLRLAEVYLIKAEAANELGNSGEALSALNAVRNRVKLPSVTTSDQATLRKAIWHERRLELAMEHDRWFDIIRTGEAVEAMRVHGKNFVTGKHELFPIPNLQLIQTPDMGQNPGW